MNFLARTTLVGWLAGLGALSVACAPDSGVGSTMGSGGDDGSGNGSSSGGNDGEGGGFGVGNGSGGNGLQECAKEAIEAELAPLTMFIAFDKSGSMDDNDKWNQATAALSAFVADPAADGLSVALRFFPDGQCDGGSCSVNACATPNVPVAPLSAEPAPADAQEQALIAAINAEDPGGGTPISAALEGGIAFSTNYLSQNPGHKAVVILVTDGEPNGCDESIAGISNIAATGLLAEVPTYTVGLQGSNEAQMAQIATAGGGSSFVVGNGNAQQALLEALQAIRGEQLACEIGVPTPENGTFDATLVNVSYTPGGGAAQTFGNVAGEGSCGTGGGWYYDDPANPSIIILCPSTCDSVQADDAGKIEVVLGCSTIPA